MARKPRQEPIEWSPPLRRCGQCALACNWKSMEGNSSLGAWGSCGWVRANLPACMHGTLRDIRENSDAAECPHFAEKRP